MIKFIRTCVSVVALGAACTTMIAQQAMPATATPALPLTLADAERLALERNPRISIARLLQLAQAQVTREARSVELPTATGSLTAVDSHAGSRITAGLL